MDRIYFNGVIRSSTISSAHITPSFLFVCFFPNLEGDEGSKQATHERKVM